MSLISFFHFYYAYSHLVHLRVSPRCFEAYHFFEAKLTLHLERLRWSRGSVLSFGTQDRGFKPGRSRRIFQGEKILSTPLPSEGK